METKTLYFKRLTDTATVPVRKTKYSVGYLLYADTPDGPITIPAGQMQFVRTGIAFRLPPYTFGGIYALPELAYHKRLYPGNSVGILEEEYNGEIFVVLRNDSDTDQTVTHGEAIAQLVVQGYVHTCLKETDTFDFAADDD